MRAIISRIVAGPIAALVAWLVGMGLELGAGFETALTEVATLFLIAVVTSLYGVVHRRIDKRLNPGDVADITRRVAPAIALLLLFSVAACSSESSEEPEHRGGNGGVVADTAQHHDGPVNAQ